MLLTLLTLSMPALAQDAEEPPESERRAQALEDANVSLQTQLDTAQAQIEALEAGSAKHAALEALISAGVTLIDDRQPMENRVEAAETLSLSGSAWALPFLRAAAQDRDPEVQKLALEVSANLTDPGAAEIGEMAAQSTYFSMSVREAGLTMLGELGTPSAAQALWKLANDDDLPNTLRRSAVATMQAYYPAVLAELGDPAGASDPAGSALFMLSSGAAGGVLLSAVGTWGQFDAGPAIGGTGGALIGVGGGLIYAKDRAISDGQGLLFTSGVGWGLTAASLTTTALHDPLTDPNTLKRDELGALYRVLGVSGGAALGLRGMANTPDPVDVLEMDAAGYLGFQLGRGLSDLGSKRNDPGPTRAVATLAGSTVGLGAGLALQDAWYLEGDDVYFAGVVASEAAVIGGLLPYALDRRDLLQSGLVRLTVHAGVAGAFTLTEIRPLSTQQTSLGLYGAAVGNALGAGIPLLGAAEDRTLLRVMLPMGAAGLAAGPLLYEPLSPDSHDWSMVGVGTALALAESIALGAVADDRDAFDLSSQYGGLVLVGTAGVSAGLLAASPVVDPNPGAMAFLGTSAIWGAWYGAIVPAAADAQWERSGYILSSTIVGDLFLVAGGVMVSPAVGMAPRDTLGAQLGGLSGATLGALGAAMFTDNSPQVAAASGIGSVAGMVTGALLTRGQSADGTARALPPLPGRLARIDLPGTLRPTFAPMVDEDGNEGVHLGLTLDRW